MKFSRRTPGLGDGRNGMLKNQLLLRARFHNQRKLVEALDATQQLGSVDEINRDGSLLAPREIEKSVLNVLWSRL